MTEVRFGNGCFGCGDVNPQGMKLVFERDEDTRRIRGRFRIGAEFQGARGLVHGGIIATILDEALGKVSRFSDVRTVTAELRVQYLKPIRVGQEIVVEAFQRERKGRSLLHEGEIRDVAGEVLARGRGRFVVINPEKYRANSMAAEQAGKTEN